jgi:hypothetical protein
MSTFFRGLTEPFRLYCAEFFQNEIPSTLVAPRQKILVLRLNISKIWSCFSTTIIAQYLKLTVIKEKTEAEFLNIIGTKEFSLMLLSQLYKRFLFPPPPPHPEQKWFETGL